jgi:hypothetical protein
LSQNNDWTLRKTRQIPQPERIIIFWTKTISGVLDPEFVNQNLCQPLIVASANGTKPPHHCRQQALPAMP